MGMVETTQQDIFSEKEALCLHLVCEKPRKLNTVYKRMM